MKRSFLFCLLLLLPQTAIAGTVEEEIFEQADYVLRLEVAVGHDEDTGNGNTTRIIQRSNLSAFIFEDEDGIWVLTAGHLVDDGIADVEEVTAFFRSGLRPPEELELVGFDRTLDVALLRFADPNVANLPIVTLGNSSSLRIGQDVVSIGHPSPLVWAMTVGRVVDITNGLSNSLSSSQPEVIVHDSIINPGSSGSPVLNLNGEVVGINVSMWANRNPLATSFSVAIPIDDVRSVLPALKSGGEVWHPPVHILMYYSGFLSDTTLRALGIGQRPPQEGLMITGVKPGSMAELIGVRPGDMVISINGQVPRNLADAYRILYLETNPNVIFEIEVERNGQRITFFVVMEDMPLAPDELLEPEGELPELEEELPEDVINVPL